MRLDPCVNTAAHCSSPLAVHLPTHRHAGLELLSVVGFSRLPPALSAVTSLTELRLGNAQLLTFQLGEEGLVALQQLPTLARLALPPLSDEDQHRVAQLRRDRPQLLVQIGGAGGQ